MFCWTKFGTEAGESVTTILKRKDQERRLNGGTFLWGIGNAIGPSIERLIHETSEPSVVFTPMLSRPAAKDVTPTSVGVWHRGVGVDGKEIDLPEYSYVTSRMSGSGRAHYALVCRSSAPLEDVVNSESPSLGFEAAHVVNLRSGSRVGASQVTSVVRQVACPLELKRSTYKVSFVAKLVPPYLLRLTEHTVMGA